MAIETKVEKSDINKIAKTVLTAIEFCKRSKIPILFLGNPGFGKTFSVLNYSEQHNYHAEVVVGADYLPEDLNGYQVYDGKESLKHMTPFWYNHIMNAKKDGKTSVLFFDEISTADPSTQKASLRIIHERKIVDHDLPDDTIIIGAANYKGNLDPEAHIIAPELNRFVLYNIGDDHYNNVFDIIDEFTQPDLPKITINFEDKQISPDYHNYIYLRVNKYLKDLFIAFAKTKNASSGYLDIFNKKYDDLYELDGNIYNILTPRIFSELCIATECLLSMGIEPENNFISMTLLGMIGAGTCNFTPEQLENYHKVAIEKYQEVYKNLYNFDKNKANEETEVTLNFEEDTITDGIKRWENYYESINGKIDKNVIELCNWLAGKLKVINWSYLDEKDEPECIAIRDALMRVSNSLVAAELDCSDQNKKRIEKCMSRFTEWIKLLNEVLDTISA